MTIDELASYFPNSGTAPFWITVEQGQVTKIAQQFLPDTLTDEGRLELQVMGYRGSGGLAEGPEEAVGTLVTEAVGGEGGQLKNALGVAGRLLE